MRVTRGSSNIFADLGLPDADTHMLKAQITIYIGRLIEQSDLNQQAAAKRMGVTQPDVSRLLRGRFEGFSLERLFDCMCALGSDIEIKLRRRSHKHGRMSVSIT